MFSASDHRARAGLKRRIGRPPCSPAAFPVVTRGEEPVCGPHNRRARKGNRDYRRSPRRRSPASDDRLVTRERPSRSSSTAAWRLCGPGHPCGEDVGPGDASPGMAVPRGGPGAQPSTALFRASGQAPLRGKTAGGNPAPSADGETRPLPAEAGKPENVAPGHRAGHVTFLAASRTPGGENVRIAVQLLETRPVLAMKPARLSSAGAGRVQARIRGPGAPANEPSEHELGRAGQAPESGARVPQRGDERP